MDFNQAAHTLLPAAHAAQQTPDQAQSSGVAENASVANAVGAPSTLSRGFFVRPWLKSMALLAPGALLVACGGEQHSTTVATLPVPADAPAAPLRRAAALTNISAADAARFLQQAQFSSTEADISQLQQLGYQGWLDQQFALPISTTISGWNWLRQQGYAKAEFKFELRPFDHMIWYQLINAKDTLRKRVALALSEIIVVSADGMNGEFVAFAIAEYWDLLNRYAFGSYRSLLQAITLNPAMGRFLNTSTNKKEDPSSGRQPDENYARELLQLFSVGLYQLNLDGSVKRSATGQPLESYTQSQITELARVFTGWSEDRRSSSDGWPNFTKVRLLLNPSEHSTLASRVFGSSIAAGTDGSVALSKAISAIFLQPSVAPFIAKQLIQRLVTSNPSPAYIQRVATVFNANSAGQRGDLKAVISAILLDPEARAAPAINSLHQGKVREPILRLVQWARTFAASSVSGKWLMGDMSSSQWRLGQSPLRAPSVFNFFKPNFAPATMDWQTAQKVAPELQLVDESTAVAYVNFMQDVIERGIPHYDDWRVAELLPNYKAESALINSPAALVSRLNLLLCANQLSSATQTIIVNAVTSIKTTLPNWQKNRVFCAVLLVMACPEYQVQK